VTTKIYLVRHGEVFNPKNVCYGRLPRFGLSKNGKKQAQRLRGFFRRENISKIYSSPLLRSRQTALIISGGHIPIGYSKKITEIDLRDYQGKDWDFAISTRNNLMNRHKFPNESYQNVQNRMVKKIMQIAKNHIGERVAIVTHADPIIATKLYFQNIPIEKLNGQSLSNGAMVVLTFNKDLKCQKIEYNNITGSRKDF
jgi:broad specificity phosphatase PhoE